MAEETKRGGTRKWDLYQPSSSQTPLISIIIATYQAAKVLPQTLDSVVAQNYPFIELIIIDGASKDETLKVVKQYEDRIDYWCSESDKGVYHAFNKGIKIAKGEWLYFLGAGDELAGTNILAQIFPVNRSTRLIYGNVSRGQKIYDGPFTRAKFCHRNICQQAIFYHRDLFTELGLFDTQYPWLADWAFNIHCFSHPETKPHFINLIIANYPSGGVSDTKYDYSFYQNLAKLVSSYGFQYSLFTRVYWWLKSWLVSNKLLAKSMRGENV